MQRLSNVVVGMTGFVVIAGCGSPPPPAPPPTTSMAAADVAPGNGATVVRYELTGTAVSVDGTYAEPAGSAETMVELRATALPWHRDFTLPPRQLFVAGLVAQGPNLESMLTCKIIRNGEVLAEQTGSTVDCRAEIS